MSGAKRRCLGTRGRSVVRDDSVVVVGMPRSLLAALRGTEPPRSTQLTLDKRRLPLLLPCIWRECGISKRVLPVVQWARSAYGEELPWREYVERLCRVDLDVLGSGPWFRQEDAAGYYLDEASGEEMSATAGQLRDPELAYHRLMGRSGHVDARNSSSSSFTLAQWYMLLFFRAWYCFPRTLRLPGVAAVKLHPRVLVRGEYLSLPYIWVDLTPPPPSKNKKRMEAAPSLRILSSTICNEGYRVMRTVIHEQDGGGGGGKKESTSSHSIATARLPVHEGCARQVRFCREITERELNFGHGDVKIRGEAALLAYMMEKRTHRKNEDCVRIHPNESGGGRVIRTEFQVDLRISWNPVTRYLGVSGDHARPDLMYYTLVSVSGKLRSCHLMHVDSLRGPGEDTCLDLCYRHPISECSGIRVTEIPELLQCTAVCPPCRPARQKPPGPGEFPCRWGGHNGGRTLL